PDSRHLTSQTVVEQPLELIASAHWISNRQPQPLRLARDQPPRFSIRKLRSIETDATAADRRIRPAAEREIQLDRVLDTRHRQLGMPDQMLASRLVAHHDHVRLTP